MEICKFEIGLMSFISEYWHYKPGLEGEKKRRRFNGDSKECVQEAEGRRIECAIALSAMEVC